MQTKKCSQCGIVKPVDNFNTHSRNKDGYQSACKECYNKRYNKDKSGLNSNSWYKMVLAKQGLTRRKTVWGYEVVPIETP